MDSSVSPLANHFANDDVITMEKINYRKIRHQSAENSMAKPLELISVHLQHTIKLLQFKLITKEN